MEKKTSKHLVGCIIFGALSAFGIVATVISIIGGSSGLCIIDDGFSIVLMFLILFYAFIGYKRPHGNLLKYIILIRTASILAGIYMLVQIGVAVPVILSAFEIGVSCYIAGRLEKAKENLILMIIVMFCIVAANVMSIVSGVATIGTFTRLIIWIDICFAYFLRYKEHKEAGLIDAPRK